jgi:hypothetical protein
MRQSTGSQTQAAKLLDVSRDALRHKLKKLRPHARGGRRQHASVLTRSLERALSYLPSPLEPSAASWMERLPKPLCRVADDGSYDATGKHDFKIVMVGSGLHRRDCVGQH